MRVLVAGATGAIGRPLVTALQRGGHEVLALTPERGPRRRHGVRPVDCGVAGCSVRPRWR